ncbi:unnamed protein product, partial [marine sediment metagenome]
DTFNGPTGPEGPQGPQGNPGNDTEFTILEGILPPGDPVFWSFEPGIALERCIISVRLSAGIRNTPAWFEPAWFFERDIIYIINDDDTATGDEFRIIIASKSYYR